MKNFGFLKHLLRFANRHVGYDQILFNKPLTNLSAHEIFQIDIISLSRNINRMLPNYFTRHHSSHRKQLGKKSKEMEIEKKQRKRKNNLGDHIII